MAEIPRWRRRLSRHESTPPETAITWTHVNDDGKILCRMCETWQPKHARHNNCCRPCNIALVREAQGEKAAQEMEEQLRRNNG